jgi:hypothetical protein
MKKTEYSILSKEVLQVKILSNEQLVFSYRDALKSGKEQEWIRILKDEIRRRGLNPIKKKK